jgi:hypothetical protein
LANMFKNTTTTHLLFAWKLYLVMIMMINHDNCSLNNTFLLPTSTE